MLGIDASGGAAFCWASASRNSFFRSLISLRRNSFSLLNLSVSISPLLKVLLESGAFDRVAFVCMSSS